MDKRRSDRKPRRGYFPRNVDSREVRERFLIVCEGGKTEPNYFLSFRVPRDVIEVQGYGYNTVSLVQKAIDLSQQEEYDQVWCVFDRDSFPAQNFNEAFSLAKRNKIQIAYSNQAFELWYLLHFNYYDTAMSRNDYCTKLSALLGRKYEKNQDDMYTLLESKQDTAIQNAQRLLDQYKPLVPENADPSTTVHLLVTQLNRFIK
jgi:hypothetical protein